MKEVDSKIFTEASHSLLQDDKFMYGPSSINHHHTFINGNFIHTVEVIDLCLSNSRVVDRNRYIKGTTPLDIEVLVLSALLHDYGKICTYEQSSFDIWVKVKFYTKSLHIYKSIDKATELLEKKLDRYRMESLIHCIGAHHGRIDYGALWEPNSPEAWILHLSDMASVFSIENRSA